MPSSEGVWAKRIEGLGTEAVWRPESLAALGVGEAVEAQLCLAPQASVRLRRTEQLVYQLKVKCALGTRVSLVRSVGEAGAEHAIATSEGKSLKLDLSSAELWRALHAHGFLHRPAFRITLGEDLIKAKDAQLQRDRAEMKRVELRMRRDPSRKYRFKIRRTSTA